MSNPARDATLFLQLVAMFQYAAMQQMGKLPSPMTGQIERDLAQGHEPQAELLERLNSLETKVEFIAVPLSYADELYALRSAIGRFTRRFEYLEDRLEERGKKPADSDLEEMDALWNDAKKHVTDS